MSSAQLTGDPTALVGQQNSHARPRREEIAQGSAVAQAILGHRGVIILCSVVLACGGAALGITRPRTYSASSTLQVGKVNPNSPGFYGFVQSATALAGAFSRSIIAEPVLADVQHRLHVAPSEAVERLSSEPIPNSPIFRVIATGSSAQAAIGLANVASSAVVAYVREANSASSDGTSLLGSYHAVSLRLAALQTETQGAERAYAHHPSSAALATVEGLKAQLAKEKLRAQAIAANYQQNSQSTTSTELVSVLANAVTATNNHTAKIELYAFIGLLLGFVAGCAMALLVTNRKISRNSSLS
jgi:hypothetical protein